jgi:predicted permease
MVLLIGAALLMVSIAHLRGVDLGFNPANLLTMHIPLSPVRYNTDQKKTAFLQELLDRTQAVPGVRSAAAAMTLPMTSFPGAPVQDASKPVLKLNERLIAKYLPISPGYFRTMGIAMRRGRDFTEHDTKDSQRVAIIDEHLARRFWPGYPGGMNPVGQRLLIGGVNPKPAEIVGIAADSHQNVENNVWPDSVYIAIEQNPFPFAMLAVRTTGDPLSFTRAIREQVRAIDRDQPITEVKTMDDLVDAEVGQRRLLMMMLGSFATVALLLAAMGIYGVIAYSVAQRTQELGIRRALGAQHSDILRLVLGQGVLLAGSGIAAGLAAAFALTRVLGSLLFKVSATDPAIFAGVSLLLLLAALAASYVPARRATRVDPMTALRV